MTGFKLNENGVHKGRRFYLGDKTLFLHNGLHKTSDSSLSRILFIVSN